MEEKGGSPLGAGTRLERCKCPGGAPRGGVGRREMGWDGRMGRRSGGLGRAGAFEPG